jgi:hypothetical protein
MERGHLAAANRVLDHGHACALAGLFVNGCSRLEE